MRMVRQKVAHSTIVPDSEIFKVLKVFHSGFHAMEFYQICLRQTHNGCDVCISPWFRPSNGKVIALS